MLFRVATTKVHDKLIVNENPNIVVATESKCLPADVGEGTPNLCGEEALAWAKRHEVTGVIPVHFRGWHPVEDQRHFLRCAIIPLPKSINVIGAVARAKNWLAIVIQRRF